MVTLLLRFARLSSSRNFINAVNEIYRDDCRPFLEELKMLDQANFNNYYFHGSAARKAEMKKNVEIIIKAYPLLVELNWNER